MGIFSDLPEQDVQAIAHIVGESLRYYREQQAKQASGGFTVSALSNFEQISQDGGRILSEFLYPTALQRVATLLVLCNAYCPFSIRQGTRPVLNLQDRREFLSIFTCLLIQAALSMLSLDKDGQKYQLQWKHFPDAYFREQFLTYLQWIESTRVSPNAPKAAKEAYIRILAQLSLGCAMALVPCVEEVFPGEEGSRRAIST